MSEEEFDTRDEWLKILDFWFLDEEDFGCVSDLWISEFFALFVWMSEESFVYMWWMNEEDWRKTFWYAEFYL